MQPPEITHTENAYAPINGAITISSTLSSLLKQADRLAWELTQGRARSVLFALVDIAAVALIVYGLIAGTLSGGMQLWAAPLKITLGAAAAAAICLPSLYVFLCMNGADAQLRQVTGLLAASVCLMAVLLVSLAPIVWVFSQSTDSAALMGTIHLFLWTVAILFSLRLLQRCANAAFGGIRPRLWAWTLIYALVSLQMMTTLRPIIGKSDYLLPKEKQFFVTHWFETLTKEAKATKNR